MTVIMFGEPAAVDTKTQHAADPERNQWMDGCYLCMYVNSFCVWNRAGSLSVNQVIHLISHGHALYLNKD